ncbi:hypothetical protein DFH09DRAFT_1113885 [Mycena vulgaris]|nr:hypothetical protein DFH09DRAFT_1113885 [Mycena vulgaris]
MHPVPPVTGPNAPLPPARSPARHQCIKYGRHGPYVRETVPTWFSIQNLELACRGSKIIIGIWSTGRPFGAASFRVVYSVSRHNGERLDGTCTIRVGLMLRTAHCKAKNAFKELGSLVKYLLDAEKKILNRMEKSKRSGLQLATINYASAGGQRGT